jgi:hypothetical protein
MISRADRRTRRRSGPPAARVLLVLFLCAGIAMLGLLAGGEHRLASARLERSPMVGYYPEGMPHYPRVNEIPAGKNSRVGGARVRMSYFDTEDEPAKVASFYARHWRARRFFVRDDVTHRGGVVSAVDDQTDRVYQVLLMVKQGRTLVFPSVTTTPARAMESLDDKPPIPLFPESRAVINLGSKEGPTSARVILSVNDGGLEANLAHYRRVLREAGYRSESRKDKPLGEQHRILLYRKADSEITINLASLGGKRVRVHIMVVGS